MSTLLKDLPEHKERIENNYLLGEELKDCLDDLEIDETSLGERFKTDFVSAVMNVLTGAEFILEGNEIKIGNRNDLALECFDEMIDNLQGGNIRVLNAGGIAVKIREKVTDFVNENYEWKGIKA